MSEDLGELTAITGTLIRYKYGRNGKSFPNVTITTTDSTGKKFTGITNEKGEFKLT